MNIRLERTSDLNTVEFSELLSGYGLAQHVSGATQNAGGTLDVVCTRDDLPAPSVDIIDIGLSDHYLLRWSLSLLRPTPIYVTSVRRCWRSFDPDVFRTDLLTSTLCDVQSHNDLDGDVLALLYDCTITGLLDRQVPARSVTCRRCLSSLFSTMNVVWRSGTFAVWREPLAVKVHSLLPPHLPPLLGAFSIAPTLNYCNGSSTRIGHSALTPTSHIRVDCGGPSMNC